MIMKVGICGASGRVGKEIAAMIGSGTFLQDASVELTDVVCGSKKLSSIEGVSVRTLEDPATNPVDVWIDFSRPDATLKLLASAKVPVVIGTTGFTDHQLEKVEEYGRKYPVLVAPNTSPGMNVMFRLLSELPKKSKAGFEAVLLEEHHRHKVDSPSGTAKRILEVLKEREYDQPEVHVTRAGGIIGTHSVKLISDREEIEIVHRVSNRSVFAEGALLAGLFLCRENRAPGLYSMWDVFDLEDK